MSRIIGFRQIASLVRTLRTWPADRTIALVSVIMAIGSTLIALSSLGLSVYEAGLARQHDRLSVKPELVMSFIYDDTGVGWKMTNMGLGPARIRGFEVFVDNVSQKPTNHLPDILDSILTPLSAPTEFSNPTLGAQIPGQSDPQIILWLKPSKAADVLKRQYGRVIFKICYCSIYDDCWEFDTNGPFQGIQDDRCSTFSTDAHSIWWDG